MTTIDTMQAARKGLDAVEADGFVAMASPEGGIFFGEPDATAPQDANGWTSMMRLRARMSTEPAFKDAVHAILHARRIEQGRRQRAGADAAQRPLPLRPALCSEGQRMITDVQDFFTKGCGRCDRFDTPGCSTKLWSEGLAKLRDICLSADLQEEVRWGQPCYRHAGRNIAILGAYQDNFVLGFFNAALMKDPEGVLERPGPNTQHADTIYFKQTVQVAALEKTIRAYLDEAKCYAKEGKAPPKNTSTPELPEELANALDADPELERHPT